MVATAPGEAVTTLDRHPGVSEVPQPWHTGKPVDGPFAVEAEAMEERSRRSEETRGVAPRRRTRLARLGAGLTVVGALLVVVGFFLPWVHREPGGIGAGTYGAAASPWGALRGWGGCLAPVFGLAVVVFCLMGLSVLRRGTPLVQPPIGAGLAIAALALTSLFFYSLAWLGFDDPLAPGYGIDRWAWVSAAGFLAALAGSLLLSRTTSYPPLQDSGG